MAKSPILSNNSHITKKLSFGILVVVFLLAKLLMELFLPNQHYTLASDLTTDNILNAVNKERALRNLVTLNPNSKLAMAAQSKADDMVARKYFAHVDPDGHYIWDKIVADGYTPYAQLGENLAIEFYDTESLMAAWMNSPTHRANILQESFRDQGMGLTFGNVQENQYYSAIANTFGALLSSSGSKQTTSPAPQKPKNVNPEPTTPTNSTDKKITSKIEVRPPVNTTPKPKTPTVVIPPIETRGQETAPNNPAPDFSMAPQNQNTNNQNLSAETQTPISRGQSASVVVGNDKTTKLNDYQVNRYLILICGVALLLLMISDIKIAVEKKLGSIDKKINNLVILIISIVVISFMYWL